MANLTSVPCGLFLLSILTSCVCSISEVSPEVTATRSGKAILPCQASRNAAVTLLEWKTSSKDSEGYVFFFRENRSYESYQSPSFKHRVQLSDPQMKNGNVSITLENVTLSDSGEYKCSYYISGTQRRKRATEVSSTVWLKVVEGGTETRDGRERLAMVVPLVALVALVAILFAVVRKVKTHTEQPAAEEAGEQQLMEMISLKKLSESQTNVDMQ